MILGGFPEQLWRSRLKRSAFLLVAFAVLATNISAPPEPPPPGPEIATLMFEPVMLDESAPDRRRIGALEFLGGWALSSNSSRFGGLSSLHVEGNAVTALSDSGTLVPLRLAGGTRARAAAHRSAGRRSGPGDSQVESRYRIDGGARPLAVGRVREAQYDLALPGRGPRRRGLGAAPAHAGMAGEFGGGRHDPARRRPLPGLVRRAEQQWSAQRCHPVRWRSGRARHAFRPCSTIGACRAIASATRPRFRTGGC